MPDAAAIAAAREQAWAAYADRLRPTIGSALRVLLKDAFMSGWLEGAITQNEHDARLIREELGT